MKRFFCLVLLLLSFSLHSFASEGVSYKILQIASRVFYNSYKPVIKIAVNNGSQVNKNGSIICRVERDNGGHVFDFEQDFSVAPLDSALLSFRFGLDKGFYKVSLLVDGKLEECVNMVYEPELVEYNIDSTLVPEIYYAKYFEQLKRLPLSVTSEKVKKTGAKERTAHKLVIKGVGGKMFEGYCLAPKKRGVYPVVITCTDRDEVLRLPEIDAYDDRIDLVISPRRAVIRNEAYYVGAYMDIIKTIDYVYGMKEADLKNIYLQGIGLSDNDDVNLRWNTIWACHRGYANLLWLDGHSSGMSYAELKGKAFSGSSTGGWRFPGPGILWRDNNDPRKLTTSKE